MLTLGELLRDHRRVLTPKVSLREMARRMEISAPFLCDLENDRRKPSEDVCRKIAEHYCVGIEDVFECAGVWGESTERYIKRNQAVIRLVRLMAHAEIDINGIHNLESRVWEMTRELAQNNA